MTRSPPLRLVAGSASPGRPRAPENDWSLLMGRAQAGDGEAYRLLLEDVTPYLRALVTRRLHVRVDVEDVVQDILLTVHRVRATYDPSLPFGPWLKAIATRRIIDRLRYQYLRNARERAILQDEDFVAEDNANFNSSDLAGLRDAVRQLSPAERKAILMLKFDELSLMEASSRSGMSIASLKVATHRGLARLRIILTKREDL
jgi:RNA polymerase sigma-70 factor (ECF subfamily)